MVALCHDLFPTFVTSSDLRALRVIDFLIRMAEDGITPTEPDELYEKELLPHSSLGA
jgi:hypothetical protein